MSETITLDRTGQTPLRFTGDLIYETSSHDPVSGTLHERWHEVRVYRTKAGKWIVAITFCTTFANEHETCTVTVCPDQAAIVGPLTGYDPVASIIGHPIGSTNFERKNAAVQVAVRDGYRACASAVFAKLGMIEDVE